MQSPLLSLRLGCAEKPGGGEGGRLEAERARGQAG